MLRGFRRTTRRPPALRYLPGQARLQFDRVDTAMAVCFVDAVAAALSVFPQDRSVENNRSRNAAGWHSEG